MADELQNRRVMNLKRVPCVLVLMALALLSPRAVLARHVQGRQVKQIVQDSLRTRSFKELQSGVMTNGVFLVAREYKNIQRPYVKHRRVYTVTRSSRGNNLIIRTFKQQQDSILKAVSSYDDIPLKMDHVVFQRSNHPGRLVRMTNRGRLKIDLNVLSHQGSFRATNTSNALATLHKELDGLTPEPSNVARIKTGFSVLRVLRELRGTMNPE